MRVVLTGLLLIAGSSFMFLAALGLLRFPDLFSRMQAGTKATTLGVSLMVLASALYFGRQSNVLEALLVIAFYVLTAPVAAHVIARTSYAVGVPLWDRTRVDELREHYDRAEPEEPPGSEDEPPRE